MQCPQVLMPLLTHPYQQQVRKGGGPWSQLPQGDPEAAQGEEWHIDIHSGGGMVGGRGADRTHLRTHQGISCK